MVGQHVLFLQEGHCVGDSKLRFVVICMSKPQGARMGGYSPALLHTFHLSEITQAALLYRSDSLQWQLGDWGAGTVWQLR